MIRMWAWPARLPVTYGFAVSLIMVSSASFTAGSATAAEAAAAPAGAKPDLSKAQATATQVCAACHGADGNSVASANPNLAGQPAEYIALQLQHFKSGLRSNPVMAAMAAPLSPEDMQQLGVYYSQQKPKERTAKDPQLVKAAEPIFRGGDSARGLPACAACHSPDGAGIPARYPRLGGQYADYTYAQLRAFQSGARGMDKEGKDVNGGVMSAIAKRLTEPEMKALADYAAGLR